MERVGKEKGEKEWITQGRIGGAQEARQDSLQLAVV